MPHTCHSQYPSGSAQLDGYLPLAPGVSTVRYPIPERIFDYVSTVRSATAGTCQLPISGELPRATAVEPSQSSSLGEGSCPFRCARAHQRAPAPFRPLLDDPMFGLDLT